MKICGAAADVGADARLTAVGGGCTAAASTADGKISNCVLVDYDFTAS